MLDQQVRQEVKEILHLTQSTAKGFFYTAKARGGLGLLQFERTIQLSKMNAYIKASQSSDPVVRETAARGKMEKVANDAARSLGCNQPRTAEEFNEVKRATAQRATSDWENLITQHGVGDFKNDKLGNAWLRNPSLLRGSRYLDALRLRTNTFGTRDVLGRTNPRMETSCRRCKIQRETLGHILGMCIHTKPERIRRHDEIKNFVADKVARRHTVMVEPTINELGELKKPDLVIKFDNEAIVADVTVRYENKSYLSDAEKEKTDKYRHTAELVRIIMGCETSSVMPLVVGSRGAIPRNTRLGLMKLGLTKQDIITVSMLALRSSIEMACSFLDYDG